MDEDKKPLKRASVLRKLNAENLQVIERGLLGDLPDRLKPNYVPIIGPVRASANELVAAKPASFLSSCLPTVPDSPTSEKFISSDDETSVSSPIKKSFSFRQKFSRISFLKKNKQSNKTKQKSILEDERNTHEEVTDLREHDYKANKRFWLFRNKEVLDNKKDHSRVYKRSKSFEFLPRAIEEDVEELTEKSKQKLRNSNSLLISFDSGDSMGEAWTSNDSLEYISNDIYHDKCDGIFLKSIKEISPDSSKQSSMSNVTSVSASSSASVQSKSALNIFNRESVQNLLDEFDKAVELFSENYLSDSEPYTKTNTEPWKEKRKSASFSTLPSPKVIQVPKVSEVSEDFKTELSKIISERRTSLPVGPSAVFPVRSARRGSVTDWFVLEEQGGSAVLSTSPAREQNKYRRAKAKPMNRVRRMSSTKYWITPEDTMTEAMTAVYSRHQRPPLVIPRITQYRKPREEPRATPPKSYSEQSPSQDIAIKSSVRHERLQNWSPTSDRSHGELQSSFSKSSSDSPPLSRLNKRFGGSTENLLSERHRRPNYLQLPASSSGDSLDVEVRDREPGHTRTRKVRSMVAPKNPSRMRSPVPAPRTVVPQISEAAVLHEGQVKRTKFLESSKKVSKKWIECYMVLTPTALYFYKDYKTYNATKLPRHPGTPPSPSDPRAELILPLKNAHALECIQNHTKRYTKSIVLQVRYDQYLIQDETEEGAKTWLKLIQNVYYRLGPKTDEDQSLNPSSNTDLESLGRTPPVSRHANRHCQKAGGSSNEDLSDSTEVSKSHVKRRLRNFFAKRPTMDSLVKKGIYQEEPVFGKKLQEVCPTNGPFVPEFVVHCIREIESNEENMCTDGLYRASGNLSQVQKIRLEVDQNNLSVIKNNTDIHVLTGSLKLFFRELKEPLIPCFMFDRVLSACSIKPREARIKEFRDIIHSLPQCNRDTLKYLLEHLLRVTEYSERNRMHTANLAIVFGPTLLWAPAEQAHNIAIDCIQQNHVVEILLNDFKEIFDDSKGKKKT